MSKFFSYCPDYGFEFHDSAGGAASAAQKSLDLFRDDAVDGWAEMVGDVCWGEVKQRSACVESAEATTCDYALHNVNEDHDPFLHHEVLDRIYCLQTMLDSLLLTHPGVSGAVLDKLQTAMLSLSEAYQQAGEEV